MITVTENAVRRLKEMRIAEQRDFGLRISVVGGGCSGLSYKFAFEREPGPQDCVVEQGGIRVFIDPKSGLYLNGMTLDYVRDQLQGRFVFANPNAKTSCGCGSSFTAG